MPEKYEVEKKVNFRVVFIFSLIIIAISVALIIIFRISLRTHKINDLKKLIRNGDFQNAGYVYNKLYVDSPMNKDIIKVGMLLHHELMNSTTNAEERREHAFELITHARKLILISFIARRKGSIYRQLADAYHELGQGFYEEALSSYKLSLENGDRSAETFINSGETAYQLTRYGKAIEFYRQAIKATESAGEEVEPLVKYKLALAHIENKDFTFVSSYLKELTEETADESLLIDIYSSLGEVYMRQSLYDESEFFYKKSIEIDDKNPKVYYNTGKLYEKMGKKKTARRYYLRAVWLDKENELYSQALKRL